MSSNKTDERKKRRTKDVLDAYLEYQANTEPPDIYKTWAGISMIAATMQRKCYLKWGVYNFYPNMYIILVGPPGKARKGTAMSPAKSQLQALKVRTAAEATTKEALIRRIAESANMYENKKGMPVAHCSLTIFSDELTVFLGYSNKELMANLADWFDCADHWTYDTKGAGTDEIHNLWVNILGATTPELMQATMPMELMGGGLSSRMIFVYAPKKGRKVALPWRTEQQEQLCKDVAHDLETIFAMQGQFTTTKNFTTRWTQWYLSKPEECPLGCRHLNYYWERREVHLLKLCMIMSASRSNEKIIRVCDFERANDILSEAERTMPYAFQGMGHRSDAQVMAIIMNEIIERETCTFKDLARVLPYDIDRNGLRETLHMFKAAGKIKIKQGVAKDDMKITYIDGGKS